MARIASQSKGGYYPTPVKEIKLVLKRLIFDNNGVDDPVINMIDPCCGTGEALSHLSKLHDNTITYGVELEESRAAKAKENLDYVIHDGYENLRTESKFSAMWLNPPYDMGFTERYEVTFLKALTGKNNVLEKDALLMFCIPQNILKDTAGVLSSRFYNVKVYRFTDDHYEDFDQVVVFGYYGKPKYEEKKQTMKFLKEVSELGPEALPTLSEEDGEYFKIKPSTDAVNVFRAGRLNIDELVKDLSNSTSFTELESSFITSSNHRVIMKNPMLPLKPTHYGIAIAAGAVSGNMGNHIVSGITKKKTEMAEKINDEGDKVAEEYTEFYQSIVRIFSPEGVFDLE